VSLTDAAHQAGWMLLVLSQVNRPGFFGGFIS